MPKLINNSVILALDVSSSCTGFAVLRNGRWSKTISSYGKIIPPKNKTMPEKLVYFRDELMTIIKSVKPTQIIIEDVFSGRNVSTTKLLARFSGVAIELSRRCLKTDPKIVLTAEVRGFLECGNKKEEAFSYICDRYNLDWKFTEMNDVADALCLALYAHKHSEV